MSEKIPHSDNPKIQEKINKAIDDMKADGTMSKIYIEIFGEDLSDSISK